MEHALNPPASETLAAAPAAIARRLRAFALLALATVAADQMAKIAIRRSLPVGGSAPLLPGWMHWSHVQNHGAAWGMLSGQRPFLIAITLVVMIGVAALAREFAGRSGLACGALGLILGGAVGNLIDRALFGAVTDFVDLDTQLQWLRDFPVWNVADAALTIGVALLILDALLARKHAADSSLVTPNSSLS